MRIIVTGANGQLGRALVERASRLGMDVIAAGRSRLDVGDAERVKRLIHSARPDVVLNAAAWTSVDDAEAHPNDVFRINRDGAANIATACADVDALMVHYSTDYVFDGRSTEAYVESDAPNPINIYGQSKLASEELVAGKLERFLVFRTSWVFSEHGRNFVKTMLRVAGREKVLRVVNDQVGKPTSAAELARLSLNAVAREDLEPGIYHLAQPQSTSWHGFAEQIFAVARRAGVSLLVEELVPVSTAEFPAAAMRPPNSVLDCSRFESAFELRIPDWHDALVATIENLKRDGFRG